MQRSWGLVSVAALAAALAVAVGASARAASSEPDVLIVGDSVATGMYWYPDAVTVMQKNLAVHWQIAICRTLAGISCPFDGERPPTLVDLVGSLGHVPAIVVVEMGYNDPRASFRANLDEALSTLVDAGARHVLWLTLHAVRPPYPTVNAELERATARWPELRLVDWNAAAAGHYSWFQNDGVHLVERGGVAMAHLVHGAVLRLTNPLHVVTPPLRLRAGRSTALILRAAGGTPPYRWSVEKGRPPRGFHLLAGGAVHARPPRGARAAFTLRVTDVDGLTALLPVRAA